MYNGSRMVYNSHMLENRADERKAALYQLLQLSDEPALKPRGHVRTQEANFKKAFQTITQAHQRHVAYLLGEPKDLHVNGETVGTY